MSQAWLRNLLRLKGCGAHADLRSPINLNFGCHGRLHTARKPLADLYRGHRGCENIFTTHPHKAAFFTKRSFASRPVQTFYASPLRRAQIFIDRKLPTQWLVYGIVGANGLVYAAWSYAEDCARRFRDFKPLQFMYGNFASSWLNLSRPWTLITSCFSHKDRNHVFVNLLSLIFMGPAAFAVLTTSQAIGLYLTAGFAGNMVQMLPWLFKSDKEGGPLAQRFVLGASGAISGVLSFFAMANPKATILMFFVVPMPAWAAVAGIVSYDMYLALAHPNGTIAAAAHLGGAAAGVLYFLRLSRLGRIGHRIF